MTIYEELIHRVEEGEPFYISFERRTLKIGKKFAIKDGVYEGDLFPTTVSELKITDILAYIELLYDQYKYSMPSERSDNKRRQYFKSLPADKLTDAQMATGARREVARAHLEGFILCMIISGQFVWDEDAMGNWFWQSKKDPDLVVLRKWIENNN